MLASEVLLLASLWGPLKLLTLFVFPAQFSVNIFDDPWQLVLLNLARRLIWNQHVKRLRNVFRLPCLGIVTGVHNVAPPLLVLLLLLLLPLSPAVVPPVCRTHWPTTRMLIGFLWQNVLQNWQRSVQSPLWCVGGRVAVRSGGLCKIELKKLSQERPMPAPHFCCKFLICEMNMYTCFFIVVKDAETAKLNCQFILENKIFQPQPTTFMFSWVIDLHDEK